MKLSYWERESLFGKIDVAIIGSGIVGLHAAIALKEANPRRRVVIVEAGPIPSGASTRNAGFACFGSMTELMDDMTQMSEEAVWDLVRMRWQGLAALRKGLGEENIGYEHRGGFELFRTEDQPVYEACQEKIAYFNQCLKEVIGEKKVFVASRERLASTRFGGINNLIHNTAEGQIHTGKMMYSLLQKAKKLEVEVFNGLKINYLTSDGSSVKLQTEEGWELSVSRAIVATNGFSRRLLPELELKPARNQVWLTEPIPNLAWQGCYHYDRGYVYFRNIGSRVLIGGGRNLAPEVETTDQFGHTTVIGDALKRLLDEVVLPGYSWQLDQKWSGIMGVGAEKKPIIRHHSDRVVLAVRLGGMGVAIGSWVGQEAARLLL